jgi:hypothetical protein
MVYGFSDWKCDSMRWNSSEASYWLPTLNLPPAGASRTLLVSLPLCLFSLHLHPLNHNSHKPLSHSVRRLCIFLFRFHAGRRCLSSVGSPMHMRCKRLAWQIPARFEASTVHVGLSVENKNMITAKQLFSDIVSNVCLVDCFRFRCRFKGGYFSLLKLLFLVGKYEIKQQDLFRMFEKLSQSYLHLKINDSELNK